MLIAPLFFTTPLNHTTTPNNPYQQFLPVLQQIWPFFFISLVVHKTNPTIPTNTLFIYTSAAIFHLPIFAYSYSYNLYQKSLPSPFNQFRFHQVPREQVSSVCTNTEVWTGIAVLQRTKQPKMPYMEALADFFSDFCQPEIKDWVLIFKLIMFLK